MNRSQRPSARGSEVAITWPPRAAARHTQIPAPAANTRVQPIAANLQREIAAAWASCGAFEWVAFSYLGISSALILAFLENLAHPFRLVFLQLCVATAMLVLCRTAAAGASVSATAQQKFWRFWRHWYPHLFFLFCFEELGLFVHLVFPGWKDAKLIAFDYWLAGVHPTIWLEQFATPARNDFMQFAYITYFIYLLALGGLLYYRKEWRAYWSVMTYSAVAYAIGYVIAIFFPIESPWFSMAGSWHGELRGGAFTTLINFIEHYGRVRGAAFPSEHVAGSFAALWGAWRHRRWFFWVMSPLVLCMCVSTIYGRYHYIADVFGGMTTGTLGYVVGAWLMKKNDPPPLAANS